MKIEKRKRIDFKNLANREKKEICCLKILKIEKRKRNENTILQLEREKHESFLLEIFSRLRLFSMTGEVLSKSKIKKKYAFKKNYFNLLGYSAD